MWSWRLVIIPLERYWVELFKSTIIHEIMQRVIAQWYDIHYITNSPCIKVISMLVLSNDNTCMWCIELHVIVKMSILLLNIGFMVAPWGNLTCVDRYFRFFVHFDFCFVLWSYKLTSPITTTAGCYTVCRPPWEAQTTLNCCKDGFCSQTYWFLSVQLSEYSC